MPSYPGVVAIEIILPFLYYSVHLMYPVQKVCSGMVGMCISGFPQNLEVFGPLLGTHFA